MIGDRPTAGLHENCGEHSSEAICEVSQSSCVEGSGTQWTCQCVRQHIQKGSTCIPIPTRILEGKYEFNIQSDASSGTQVGQIPLLNVEGIVIESTVTLVPDSVDLTGVIAPSSSLVILTKRGNIIFINPVHMTLIVSSRLSDHSTVVDYTEVIITPNITSVETGEIILAEGTRSGSFVSEIPGLNKYTSADGSTYKLAGTYIGYFSVDGHGDIICKETISFEKMSQAADIYAFVTELNIIRNLQGSDETRTVAKLSILIVRDKFSLEIPEDKVADSIIGKFGADSSSIPFDFNLTDVSTPPSFFTYFKYDSISGNIGKSSMPLDFTNENERKFNYEIRLKWHSHRDFVRVPGEMIVTDVNNNAPKCTNPESIFQVISGSPSGSYIGLIQTSDVDTVGAVTYTITDAVYSKSFTVTPDSGVIIADQAITASLLGDRIKFTVNADDGFRSVDCLVVIEILKLSDENANLALTFTGTLREELPPVHVANVFVQNYTNFKFMTTKDDEYFQLNGTTGEVRSIKTLDRENLPYGFRGNTITYGIQANLDDEDSCTITIMGDLTINVTDINDNAPCFKITDSYCTSPVTFNGSVRENSTDQQEVLFNNHLKLEFFDPDESDNDDLTVTLIPGHEYFTFEASHNVIKIITIDNVVLDREKIDLIHVTLHVKDTDGIHTATATLSISVLDVNDNPPIFTSQSYAYNVTEGASVGVDVGFVSATDQDIDENAVIRYSMYSSFFHVNETTGMITTKGKLDRESIASFNVTLLARDNGQPRFTATATVSIQILDVNDNNPTFTQHEYRFKIDENNNCSIPLDSVTATDEDIDENGEISFTVSNHEEFTINKKGEIFCKIHSLDYESNHNHVIVVTASDGGDPSRSSTTRVVIEVMDENDNPPLFTHNVTIVNVTANHFNSPKLVALLQVTDRDSGDNGRFHFDICNKYSNYFIVSDDGAVSTNGTTSIPGTSLGPDCEVTATDYGGKPLFSSALIKFYVVDSTGSGGSGVTFNSSDITFRVAEVHNNSTILGSLSIKNNRTAVVFTMISSADGTIVGNNLTTDKNKASFYLDPESGMVTKSGVLDRETKDTYTFLASVEEAAAKDLTLVNISVTDVNEDPRFVTQLKQLGVNEDAINYTISNSVIAEDDDIGENGVMVFNLTKQKPQGGQFNFGVNTTHGNISVVRALDYETVKKYNITIEVRDKGSPPLSATRVFEVLVHDVNDNPPTFVATTSGNGQCLYGISVREDVTVDSVVLDFAIADRDSLLMFKRSSLSVRNPDDCPLKSVIHAFPDISLLTKVTLDYETKQDYTCLITATNTEPPNLSSNCSVHVTVLDVNDNFPQTLGPYTVNVTNEKINDVILDINATDEDSGENSRLMYRYSEETDSASFFGIDQTTGRITITKDLFQFTSATASLHVVVSDNGSSPKSNCTTVTINILTNNTEPWFQGQSPKCSGNNPNPKYSSQIVEIYSPNGAESNEAIDDELLNITACDKDGGEFVKCNCSYEFVESANVNFADYFEINKATGMVRQIKPVDREKTPHFLLNISATDHGNPPRKARTNAILNISVSDLDDNPPRFENLSLEFAVSNNSLIGYSIGPVRAVDPDNGINSTATYTVTYATESSPFIYNDTSGYFQVSESLTNLTNRMFVVLLTATGVTTPSFSDRTTVIINVFFDDPNKATPTFNQGIYEDNVPYTATKGYSIGTYTALDTDSGIYGEIKYSLESTYWDTFVVDSKRGNISLLYAVIDAIPYYIKSVNLTLWATDGGIPPKSGSCQIHITLTGADNKECSVRGPAKSIDTENAYETPLYAVIGLAACLLLVLVICFLVMFSRNRVVLSKYKMSEKRLSTLQDPYDSKAESYQRLSKTRPSGVYNKTFDFESGDNIQKDNYDQLEEYERVPEPDPEYDYETTPI